MGQAAAEVWVQGWGRAQDSEDCRSGKEQRVMASPPAPQRRVAGARAPGEKACSGQAGGAACENGRRDPGLRAWGAVREPSCEAQGAEGEGWALTCLLSTDLSPKAG